MSDLESVTKKLYSDSTAIEEVRALFDGTIDAFPETSSRLKSKASIVHCLISESAIISLQRGNIRGLSCEECISVEQLEIVCHNESPLNEESMSFVERALKTKRGENHSLVRGNVDTRCTTPVSNACERLFS